MLVKIKWNKQVFDDVELDPSNGVEVFKSQIYSLTGVPMDRQKLMAKGAWIGVLKDDADMTKLKIKDGQQITLMGTAEVIAAPEVQVQFVEDMTDAEKAEKGTVEPAGLQNLGNTCYMNSTIQCVRHMPELREALSVVNPSGPMEKFTVALRETFNQLDRSTQAMPPMQFVSLLRSMFPQYAQTSERSGGYVQQDAEEFYNTMVQTLSSGLQNAGKSLSSYLEFEVEETMSCAESELEQSVTRRERMNKLVCNIQGGSGSTSGVDHLQEGLKLAMEGTVEKNSEILGRNAVWNKKQRLSQLPRYICVQFMRFFWKPTPESMDHAGVKCKILRPVSYPEVLDVYEFCNEKLQTGLRANREKAEKIAEEYYAKKFKASEDADVAASSAANSSSEGTAMEIDDAPASTESKTPDTETVDFGEGIPSDFRGQYELMGVVTHKGRSANSGHYIGWVRQAPESHIWWKYDDDKVTEVSTADIMELKGGGDWHTAYLNFYRYKC
mmetsp:Transcript_25499/g.37630  ORF Transcript_25499/g.37630 Transcript_25499/m.37630 type:complete len:497 (-) Transcript_25499:101-1591(-)|eukprot:CAMPEP_0185029314 /NCGR_PEP_ID=MMETSP1103-20130426/15538_1 /TAXON_ID=36769 /ORGANISM="Paraphysomonas bandaiensis, Strain Caron Lab Isolate" /LENGTH=496 /DNA_ID=CAMNT_0027564005 /DNA_START=78 /DNA_END=1568 /DNA_ORIENTATION=-